MSQNPNTTNITPPTGGTPVSAPVPAPPQFLPKGTPKEQASAITRDIANTLGPSDNPIADAYGAARPQPFKPEGSSGGVMQQVHNKLSPLLAYLENEKNQEVQALLAEFGGDKMGVIKQALDLCGVNSHTSFSNIMRDLVENDTHAAKFINSDAPVQDKRAAVNAYRQLQIKSLQSEIRAQAQEWISEGFDLQSVALLLNGKGATKVVSSQGLPIIQYAGLNIARKLRDSLIAIPDTTKRVSTALSYLRQYGVSKPQLKAVVNSSDKQLQEAVENFDQTTDLTNEYNQEQVGLNAPQSDTATLINEFVKIVGRAKFLEMAKTAKSLVPGRVSVLNSGKGMTMARYWNGTPIGPGDTDYNQPTSKNEILSEVGLDSRNFPIHPSEFFDDLTADDKLNMMNGDDDLSIINAQMADEGRDTYTLEELDRLSLQKKRKKISAIKERMAAEGRTKPTPKESGVIKNLELHKKRTLPENIALVNKYCNDAENPKDLLNIISTLKRYKTTPDNGKLAQFLKYVLQTLCSNNTGDFDILLSMCGFGAYTQASKKEPISDDTYPGFGFTYGSIPEKNLVDKLRNTFGLMAIAYPLAMPAPHECPVGKHMKIDFTITCDVLQSWEAHEDKQMHPRILPQIVFVGEYFGFSKPQIKEITEKWINPDGSMAKTTGANGESQDIVPGVTINGPEEYNLKAQWKRMTETAVAQAVGGRAIFIDHTLDDRHIMGELDRCSILYQTTVCAPGDMTCAIAYHTLISHSDYCKDANCQVWQYVDPQTHAPIKAPAYGPACAYVMSCIADFKLQRGLLPTTDYYSDKQTWSRENMWKFYQNQQEQYAKTQAAWQQYLVAQKDKSPQASEIFSAYTKDEQNIGSQDQLNGIHQKVMDNINRKNSDRINLEKLEALFENLRKMENSGEEIPTYEEIVAYCSNIISPLPTPKNDYTPMRLSQNWYSLAKQGVSTVSLQK